MINIVPSQIVTMIMVNLIKVCELWGSFSSLSNPAIDFNAPSRIECAPIVVAVSYSDKSSYSLVL